MVNTRSDERAGGRGGPSLRGETANRSGSRAGHFLIRALVAALAIVLLVVTFTISLVVFCLLVVFASLALAYSLWRIRSIRARLGDPARLRRHQPRINIEHFRVNKAARRLSCRRRR